MDSSTNLILSACCKTERYFIFAVIVIKVPSAVLLHKSYHITKYFSCCVIISCLLIFPHQSRFICLLPKKPQNDFKSQLVLRLKIKAEVKDNFLSYYYYYSSLLNLLYFVYNTRLFTLANN